MGSERLVLSGMTTGSSAGGIYTLDLTDLGEPGRVNVSGPIVSGGCCPVWSPDNQWIAWVKNRGDKLMLYRYNTGPSYEVASGVLDPDWLRTKRQ